MFQLGDLSLEADKHVLEVIVLDIFRQPRRDRLIGRRLSCNERPIIR